MQTINEAYLILKDDEARKRYNREYQKFQEFNKKKKTSKEEKTSCQDYSSNDEILNDWIRKAKEQAKEMLIISIEDLVGMSKAATSAAWDRTKILILFVFVANIILVAIYS